MHGSAVDAPWVARRASRLGLAWSLGLLVTAAILVSGCATGAGTPPSATGAEDELRRLRADVAVLTAAVARLSSDGEHAAGDLRRRVEEQAQQSAMHMDAVVVELGRLSVMLADVTARLQALGNRADRAAAEAREQQHRLRDGVDAVERTVTQLTESVTGLDARVTSLQQHVAHLSSAATEAAAAPRPDNANAPAASSAPAQPPPATAPEPPVTTPPVSAPSAAPAPLAPPMGQRGVGSFRAQDIYDAAYLDFSRGSYSLAIGGFGEVLRRFPDSPLADNAQYWIGEAHWGLARWHEDRGQAERATDARRQAVAELAKVVEHHRRGDKAPAALYRQALILLELGETEQARQRLEQLVDAFPQAAESRLAREQLSGKRE